MVHGAGEVAAMKAPQTEQEWADFYQAHKDDPDIWGDPEPAPLKRPRGRPSQGRSAVITVRFTPEEAAIIRREAEAMEVTYSEVIRRAIQRLAEQPPRRTTDPAVHER